MMGIVFLLCWALKAPWWVFLISLLLSSGGTSRRISITILRRVNKIGLVVRAPLFAVMKHRSLTHALVLLRAT